MELYLEIEPLNPQSVDYKLKHAFNYDDGNDSSGVGEGVGSGLGSDSDGDDGGLGGNDGMGGLSDLGGFSLGYGTIGLDDVTGFNGFGLSQDLGFDSLGGFSGLGYGDVVGFDGFSLGGDVGGYSGLGLNDIVGPMYGYNTTTSLGLQNQTPVGRALNGVLGFLGWENNPFSNALSDQQQSDLGRMSAQQSANAWGTIDDATSGLNALAGKTASNIAKNISRNAMINAIAPTSAIAAAAPGLLSYATKDMVTNSINKGIVDQAINAAYGRASQPQAQQSSPSSGDMGQQISTQQSPQQNMGLSISSLPSSSQEEANNALAYGIVDPFNFNLEW